MAGRAGMAAGEAKISTWLYRVASNLCTDRLRKSRPRGLDDAPEVEDVRRRSCRG